jgi:hypothetical protein
MDINKIFTQFNRDENVENKADLGEKVGNFGLGLLRIGFGKSVKVEVLQEGTKGVTFTPKIYSTSKKAAAIGIAIIFLPATILLAGVGCIGVMVSESHKKTYGEYKSNPTKEQKVEEIQKKHEKQEVSTEKKIDTKEDIAAIMIQKMVRGHLSRKPLLPRSQYAEYSKQAELASDPKNNKMEKAKGGKTTVFLPKDMPGVVLKKSGEDNVVESQLKKSSGTYQRYDNVAGVKRFHEMQEVRTVLKSLHCENLVIPRASLYKAFLVEERLPINTDAYFNMSTYMSNVSLFDDAVCEMTRLLSKVNLIDLVNSQRGVPLNSITGTYVRYDNLPLYIEGKKGKIGLIDLEGVTMKTGNQTISVDDVVTLIRIYPFHADLIKKEAAKFGVNIENPSIQKAEEAGKKYFKEGYTDHLNWLKTKNVTPQSICQVEVSPERKTALAASVESELLKLNDGTSEYYDRKNIEEEEKSKNFLGDKPQEAAEAAKGFAAAICPVILDQVKSAIAEGNKGKAEEEVAEHEMLGKRSVSLNIYQINLAISDAIEDNQEIQPYLDKIDIVEQGEIIKQLMRVALKELAVGQELFTFNPDYSGNDNWWWIRF